MTRGRASGRPHRPQGPWLALAIGNSQWHWGQFVGAQLRETWDSPPQPAGKLPISLEQQPIALASVVPESPLQLPPTTRLDCLTLERVPLHSLYPTLGIDRALALWGAGRAWGWPMLVIDAGTALTVTAADGDRTLLGGAVWPGLTLQLRALNEGTAAIPPVPLPESLPPRFALDTVGAVQSGVVYGALAALGGWLQQWRSRFPRGQVGLTGGDGKRLMGYWRSVDPEAAAIVRYDPHLLFWGMGDLAFGGRSGKP